MSGAPDPLADALRGVMRRVPSPVTVVTSVFEGQPVGATVGSFTSVSLAPPLFSFNLQPGSVLRAAVEAGAPFAVHVLGHLQDDLARRFARPDLDPAARFDGFDARDGDGVPRLPCLARVRGTCHLRISAGDHLLVVAAVTAVDGPALGEAEALMEPLVYLDRSFGRMVA